MVSISARMVVLLGGYVIGCGAVRNAPASHPHNCQPGGVMLTVAQTMIRFN